MKDRQKTKKQRVEESKVLRNQLVEPKNRKIKRKPVKKTQQESEETLRALAENASDGIFVTIGEGLQAYANKRASEITGYSVAELLESTIKDLVHPDELEKIMERYRKRLAGEPIPIQYETIIIRKDGKSIPIELTASKTVWQGQPADLVIVRDISERKQAGEELRKSEGRFRRLVETMKVGLSTIDENGVITYVNDQLCSMLGYSMDEMVGHPNFDFLDEENRQTLECLFAKRKKGGQDPAPYELTWLRKDGQKVHTIMSPTPFFDRGKHHESRYTGAYAIITDITKLKQAEEALEQTRLLLEAVLEQSPVPIVVVSGPDLVVRYKNRAAIDFLGVTDEPTYLGLTLPQVKRRQTWEDLNPDGTPTDLLNLPLARALRGETTRNEEYGVIRKDGTQRWELVSGTPIYSRSGELVAGLVVFPDITERKQAEAERQAHVWFIESMARINEAMYGTNDLEQMMGDVLTVVLAIYNCDRASLVYPCDPEAASWRAIMEQTRLEYPGALALGLEVPIDPDVVRVFRTLRASSAPVKFGPGSPHPLPQEVAERFQEQSQLAMAIYPKGDKPWMFVIHQCSYPRAWTPEEERLFQAIGNRLADGLTSLLAHRSLRESEERFRLAFENANTGVCLVDLEGHLTKVNNKMCEIFGYTKEELEHMTVNNIAHPEDINKSPSFIQKTLRGEIDRGTFEKRYLHKKGHVVTCQVSSSLVRNADGSPLYFISHVHDITDRKRADAQIERALRETRVRFEVSQTLAGTQTEDEVLDALIQHAGLYPQAFVVIFTLDKRGGELAAIVRRQNPFESGLTTVMPIGGSLPVSRYTLFGRLSADRPFISEDIWADKQIEPAGREILGQTGAASFAMFPLTVESEWMGLILAMAKSTNYFDEEKQHLFQTLAEQGTVALRAAHLRQQIRESQQRFKDLVETLSDWIWEVDQNGFFTYVSPRISDLLGYEREELLGKTPFDFMLPEETERVRGVFDQLFGNRQPMVNVENTLLHKDGRLVVFETSAAPFFNADGQFRGYRGVDRDITERKRAEKESEVLREQLRQSQKMEAIGRLAGGIAHDFNNLLTIIKGYSQLSLIELKEDSPLKKNIEHIHGATDRAANLVRQLLAFSRRQIMEMKVLDLNTILTNLDNMLRRVIGEDIELTTILAEDLGRVKTDQGWIEQAIMNLVVNSRDAMPSGGKLTIETGNADLDEASAYGHFGVEPGRYVMLSVSDTGVGITQEVMERLFEPFFSTKEKDKGTGLGLSTVYGIVKQSDGDIWVYSEPGKGSTFKIYLPRVDEPAEQPREKVSGDELFRGTETILLVEDEEEVRKLALRVLERQGYKVFSARDGDDALLICEQFKDPIHLMLTDVVMPGMSGHELAKRLKSLHPKMKVLYMSGYTDDTIVLHGVLVEGVNYIQKPFTVDALTKKVREVLEK